MIRALFVALVRHVPFVRELEAELGRVSRAFESAGRYVNQLEAIKRLQEERIAGLEGDVRNLSAENARLRGQLSGRRPS